ncbi:MAG TPA: DNA gyrase subunit A, partial [Myxococcales bacterium]
ATNIPPHNLDELCDALRELSLHKDLKVSDLLKHIKGPDFPTGGQILNSKSELKEIYETGQGSIRVRGEYQFEDLPRGGKQIVVTSIPYAVNKSSLVMKFGDLVRERKLTPLVDVRDESTKDVRIVLEIKRDADPEMVMAYLYKHTPLQTSFGVNLTCLVPTDNPEIGTPKKLDLKSILRYFLDFRFQVVTRRFEYDLEEVQKRLHILEGFEKVYDALDEMVKIIRKSEGKDDSAKKLIKRFRLSEEQADAILEMKLYRLAKLEILVIEKEAREKRAERKQLKSLLGSDRARWAVVRDEIHDIQKKYGDKRRTRIGGAGAEELEYSEEAFIADEDAHVVLTRDGWIKRVREIKDPSQTRVREGDEVAFVLAGSLKSNLVIFSNFGTAYVTRFNDIPPSTGYGDPVQKLFKFDDRERVVGALSLDPRLPRPEKMFAMSRRGYGLRFALAPHSDLSTRAGRRFSRPAKEDEIIGVVPVGDRDRLAVITEKTHWLVMKANEVNELAGPGRGVTVIKTGADDKVVAFICSSHRDAAIALESSKGRKLELTAFGHDPAKRGGHGRQMIKREKAKAIGTGPVIVQLPPSPEEKK